MKKTKVEKDVEKNWQENWKHILEKPDGSIDKDQLKKELMDFSFMIDNTVKIMEGVTGGRVTNPMTMAFEVVDAMNASREDWEKTVTEDNKENGYCTFCEQDIREDEDDEFGNLTPDSVLN